MLAAGFRQKQFWEDGQHGRDRAQGLGDPSDKWGRRVTLWWQGQRGVSIQCDWQWAVEVLEKHPVNKQGHRQHRMKKETQRTVAMNWSKNISHSFPAWWPSGWESDLRNPMKQNTPLRHQIAQSCLSFFLIDFGKGWHLLFPRCFSPAHQESTLCHWRGASHQVVDSYQPLTAE